ncbi:KTSC domain-containing protein [Chelativorans sp. M5D2P16]|uniref:KTSC domain-containing protein n=1 Tax=Chelativorans sp. M5D2P16 TaxID=3095678 RepID=UPI002ACA9604|nr:KTSC domain-containing protein [Chelativorans sp. M5D2P16]MDZ5698029.1 KTSC domain-containing protein [Chelativorans sp. M5D2P16]
MAQVERTRFPDSTAVRAIRYFAGRQALEVTFASGGVYVYHGVPREVFARFKSAESAGRFLHREILDRYRHTRVG